MQIEYDKDFMELDILNMNPNIARKINDLAKNTGGYSYVSLKILESAINGKAMLKIPFREVNSFEEVNHIATLIRNKGFKVSISGILSEMIISWRRGEDAYPDVTITPKQFKKDFIS